MPKLHFLTGPRAGECVTLGAGLWTIGRAPDNAVVIREPTVSARHCELLVQGTHMAIRDLGTRNGTFVNGASAGSDAAAVTPGSRIRLGAVELQSLEDSTRTHAPPGPAAPEHPSRAQGALSPTTLATGCDRRRCPFRTSSDSPPPTVPPRQSRLRTRWIIATMVTLVAVVALALHLVLD